MSTSNFGTPKYKLPLVADGLEYNEAEAEFLYEDRKAELDAFNEKQKYFEIEIIPGYYDGWYYDAKELQDYWAFDDIDELTDEDADYFFGDTAENVKAEMTAELEAIKNKLDELVEMGAEKLEKVATFSNGEAVYRAL